MANEAIKLKGLKPEEVPADLRAATYFDFKAHPFEHEALFEQTNSVCGAILGIGDYCNTWLGSAMDKKRSAAKAYKNTTPKDCRLIGNFEVLLEAGAVFEPARVIGSGKSGVCHTIYLAKGAKAVGSDIYIDKGSIYLGAGASVEPCAGLKGPLIAGKATEIRQGAYLRGNVILGDGCIIRGEIKNSVLMNKANFPHPSYLGDSLCGYMTHFGNQATSANIGIFASLVDSGKRRPIVVKVEGKRYDLGTPKMGICMGDYSQCGCNSVSDPATFLKPYTLTYSLTRITKGFYGPCEILKNKPLEHGVIERCRYNPAEELGSE
ncbi:MAG: hypothetical protein WC381_09880 [Kiritimatiellia bacterium]|jgi:hypothetical protein